MKAIMAKKIDKFLLILFTLGLISFSANAGINVESVKTGNIGSITFNSDQNLNLGKKSLKFVLSSGAKVSSVWGFDEKISFKQAGQTVSLNVTQWWPENSDYILPAGKTVTVSFLSSVQNYTISNIRIGNSSQHRTVKNQFTNTEKRKN
ncbi:hypothetical protein P0136_10185 [Lentisphaerota bacterium ZTH]|nr:hypothetical protein JYG24_12305 [Lentisphaerota bacterium]WET05729.1 hypothetical protein P0136_10185 [Lentisphaerota bacterium ZTH]